MNCLDCKNADECHREMMITISSLNKAIKALEKGYFYQGIEELELLEIRLIRIANRNVDRI